MIFISSRSEWHWRGSSSIYKLLPIPSIRMTNKYTMKTSKLINSITAKVIMVILGP